MSRNQSLNKIDQLIDIGDVESLISSTGVESGEGSDEENIEYAGSPKKKIVNKQGMERFKNACHHFFLGTKINYLLVFIPICFITAWSNGPKWLIFITSLISLCPLAERLSFVTEDLCKYTNPTLGGLINATFGNATELIVSLIALFQGKYWVVQTSLVGSMLSNSLLVLGTAFLVGGYKHHVQHFNKTVANTNVVLLLVSVTSILVPSVLVSASDVPGVTVADRDLQVLTSSRVCSLFLIIAYGMYLFFQMRTHPKLFEEAEGEEEEEEEQEEIFGLWGALGFLAGITVIIAFLSEYMTDTIEEASLAIGVPSVFVSTILLPIAGNACEHAGAIIFAYKNKIAVSLGIAIGSVIQIALFVIPFIVIVGWMGNKQMTLNFSIFETWTLFITSLLVAFCIAEGESNWLKGALLIVAYVIISIGYWVHIPFAVSP